MNFVDQFGFLLNAPNVDVQIFNTVNSLATPLPYNTWNKPKGAVFVYIHLIGAGGGGGNGFSRTAGSAGGGGGGGGTAGFHTALIPAWLLPDVLYVNPGAGGAAASGGNNTWVQFHPAASVTTLVVLTVQGAGGGATGASTGAAAGGTIGTQVVGLGGNLAAVTLAKAGTAGGAGGNATGAAGANGTTWLQSSSTGPGSGGGGATTTDFAGGSVPLGNNVSWGQNGVYSSTNYRAAGAAGGGAGQDGLIACYNGAIPMMGSGASGGGSNNTGTGGAGGNATIGGGGGGGGAGVTGGAGGRGGNGLIYIISMLS